MVTTTRSARERAFDYRGFEFTYIREGKAASRESTDFQKEAREHARGDERAGKDPEDVR